MIRIIAEEPAGGACNADRDTIADTADQKIQHFFCGRTGVDKLFSGYGLLVYNTDGGVDSNIGIYNGSLVYRDSDIFVQISNNGRHRVINHHAAGA